MSCTVNCTFLIVCHSVGNSPGVKVNNILLVFQLHTYTEKSSSERSDKGYVAIGKIYELFAEIWYNTLKLVLE